MKEVPFSAEEMLRIQFRKHLRKGHIKNAELDPAPPAGFQPIADPCERTVVRIDSTSGKIYWFTGMRVVEETGGEMRELFCYASARHAYWMFRHLKDMHFGPEMKRRCFDRLEIETVGGVVVLEGLDQAYVPTLKFFWSLTRSKRAHDPESPSKGV